MDSWGPCLMRFASWVQIMLEQYFSVCSSFSFSLWFYPLTVWFLPSAEPLPEPHEGHQHQEDSLCGWCVWIHETAAPPLSGVGKAHPWILWAVRGWQGMIPEYVVFVMSYHFLSMAGTKCVVCCVCAGGAVESSLCRAPHLRGGTTFTSLQWHHSSGWVHGRVGEWVSEWASKWVGWWVSE